MAPSIWQLLIVLVIVVLLFGTKRLKGLGGDLGSAFKGFKKAMNDDSDSESEKKPEQLQQDADFKNKVEAEDKQKVE